MKRIAIFLGWTCIFPLVTAAFASSVGPTYRQLPSMEERAQNPSYRPFPGWDDLAIVKDSNPNIGIAKVLPLNRLEGPQQLVNLKNLVLEHLDIQTGDIKYTHMIITVPFIVSVAYQERGISGLWAQGTLEAAGVISITLTDDRVSDVTITAFDDSWGLDRLKRRLGIVSAFNGSFINNVVPATLRQYFLTPDHLIALLNLVQSEAFQRLP